MIDEKKDYKDLEMKIYEMEEKERRRKENIKKALAEKKRQGYKLGRPKRKKPLLFYSVEVEYRNGEITQKQACEELGVKRETFLRWIEDGKQ